MSSSPERKHHIRTKFLIHPKFQLLLLGVNLGVILLFSTIVWFTVQNTLLDLKPVAGLSGREAEFYQRYLDYQANGFRTSILVSMFIGLLVSGGVTLVLSHRIAGPLVRMRNYFRRICETDSIGQVAPLEFRDGDYLNDLPPLINEAMTKLQSSKRKNAA